MQTIKLAQRDANADMLPARHLAAVLTGDLVGSSAAGSAAVQRAMVVLASAAEAIDHYARTDTRFTRFRGDGWQLLLDDPATSLWATLLLTARLRASDTGLATRIAIGIGPIESIGSDGLGDAGGAAFTLSGRLLDRMPADRRLGIKGPDQSPDQMSWQRGVTPWHSAILALIDHQTSRWTAAQAEAVALALEHADETQAQLAARLGVTRQAVQSRLAGAGLAALEPALNAFDLYPWTEAP
jgi:hypothetical protein